MKERRIYELMIGKLLEVAENNPDGFTVRLPTLDFVKSGWVIAMAETQNCHGYEGMERAIGVAIQKPSPLLGGWRCEDDGKFYWDAVMVTTDKVLAQQLGKINNQLAIYHLDSAEVIWL